MGRIKVSTSIAAPPSKVWAAVHDIADHTEWMADAEAIRLTKGRPNRVGATYEVDTKVGPIALLDVMEVTEWEEGRTMGVRHVGLVTGTGRFTLKRTGPLRRRGTRFTWQERLTYPWWMGGPVGGIVADQVMKRIWARNLRSLKRLVEEG